MKRRLLLLLAPTLAAFSASPLHAQPPSPVGAARQLLQATPAAQRHELLQPFTDPARSDWHYTPRRRDGIAWKSMSTIQREATTALLRTALNESGLDKVRALMALEIALRQLEGSGSSFRDPENYAIALYGEPGAAAWGWRIEGHHLSLHFSLAGERYVATLPQFFGANPATEPKRGFRLLGHEEDLARQWLASLTPAQRSSAVFSSRSFGDIVSGNAPRAKPLDAVGLPFADMEAGQQAQVLKLIAAFADHLQPDLAQARLERVRRAPLDGIRMGWAGSTQPGQPFYFRIQGAAFLIEFDNSGGNHVHSVWRDFDGDFGRDVLAEHYRKAGDHGR
ncbi:DUF3500 domain-containing protein [Roseateles sp. NT4]|uniref:DUF3500 domain-containing protein n=1 Tax=Roseateles sp. NT4 TaxID=3453715 RepID=UPI003EEA180F